MPGKHAKPKPTHARNAALAVVLGGGVSVPLLLPGSASAAVLGPSQIAAAAKAGCPQLDAAQINTSVKIAMGESGGNASVNAAGPEDSRGLWQINAGVHGSPWGNLYDPVTNARAMCDLSHGGTSWNAWTVYTNGSYLSQPGYLGSVTPRPTLTRTPPPLRASGAVAVRVGDTLWKISPGHNWKPVCAKNKLPNCNVIYPGQRIIL